MKISDCVLILGFILIGFPLAMLSTAIPYLIFDGNPPTGWFGAMYLILFVGIIISLLGIKFTFRRKPKTPSDQTFYS